MNNKITIILYTGLTIICLMLSDITIAQEKNLDQLVEEKLATLSLEDKVGEMTQLAIDVLMEGQPYGIPEPQNFDPEKLQNILVDLKVGSILNVAGHAWSREKWKEVISTIQDYAINKKGSGIPVLYGIDAIHGANYTLESTLFPQQLAQAASWNLDISKKIGEITAYETRASGIPWNFSPVLDMGRDPRWSRLWETYGEDVHLAAEIGTTYIKGLQGEDISNQLNVAACMKHFLGYSAPMRGKDRTQAWIPERQLREYYVPTFKAAIEADAKTIMICSGEMNGIPVHANKAILTDLLRNELGFKGLAVSDWDDVPYLFTRHRVATDFKDAIRIAINAGLDMVMVPMDSSFPTLLKELVLEGKVSITRIDEAVSRILRLKYELDLFNNPVGNFEAYPDFASDKHQQAALDASRESIILAKNDGTLPFRIGTKVLVTGPTANSLNVLNGGWSRTWQGQDTQYNTPGKKTIAEALADKFGADRVNYVQGTSFDQAIDIEAAVKQANQADIIIACLGEMTYCEKPGDIDNMDLPQVQIDLVKALKATGKPVVLVLIEGRPRIISPIVEDANAILVGFLPGTEGSIAISEILAGQVNPSAKFPITYPKFANDLVNYDHKGTDLAHRDFSMNGFNPQWEFGYGLSYTQFEYSDLEVDTQDWLEKGELRLEVKVANTGNRKGKEVVQVYISDKVASITPPVKRLRAFDKIELNPGEAKTLNFVLYLADLAFIGQDNTWITEPGDYEVMIGNLKEAFHLKR